MTKSILESYLQSRKDDTIQLSENTLYYSMNDNHFFLNEDVTEDQLALLINLHTQQLDEGLFGDIGNKVLSGIHKTVGIAGAVKQSFSKGVDNYKAVKAKNVAEDAVKSGLKSAKDKGLSFSAGGDNTDFVNHMNKHLSKNMGGDAHVDEDNLKNGILAVNHNYKHASVQQGGHGYHETEYGTNINATHLFKMDGSHIGSQVTTKFKDEDRLHNIGKSFFDIPIYHQKPAAKPTNTTQQSNQSSVQNTSSKPNDGMREIDRDWMSVQGLAQSLNNLNHKHGGAFTAHYNDLLRHYGNNFPNHGVSISQHLADKNKKGQLDLFTGLLDNNTYKPREATQKPKDDVDQSKQTNLDFGGNQDFTGVKPVPHGDPIAVKLHPVSSDSEFDSALNDKGLTYNHVVSAMSHYYSRDPSRLAKLGNKFKEINATIQAKLDANKNTGNNTQLSAPVADTENKSTEPKVNKELSTNVVKGELTTKPKPKSNYQMSSEPADISDAEDKLTKKQPKLTNKKSNLSIENNPTEPKDNPELKAFTTSTQKDQENLQTANLAAKGRKIDKLSNLASTMDNLVKAGIAAAQADKEKPVADKEKPNSDVKETAESKLLKRLQDVSATQPKDIASGLKKHGEVLDAALNHPNLDTNHLLGGMQSYHDSESKQKIKNKFLTHLHPSNGNVSSEHISKILELGDPDLGIAALNHPNATEQHFTDSLEHTSKTVRAKAEEHKAKDLISKMNSNTASDNDMVQSLLNSKSFDIASKHKSLTKDHVEKAIKATKNATLKSKLKKLVTEKQDKLF